LVPDAQKLIFASALFGIANTIVAATKVKHMKINIAIEFVVSKIIIASDINGLHSVCGKKSKLPDLIREVDIQLLS
jgi:hypothetical protein